MEDGEVSPTLKVLREVRDQLQAQGDDLRALRQHVVESEIRVATHLTDVVVALHDVRDVLRENLPGVKDRLDDHERRLGALERRGRRGTR